MQSCRWVASVGLSVAVAFAGSVGSSAETPTEIGARLKTAAARDSLSNADAKPWHLKMDVTIFDDEGKNPQTGTIEVWRSGGNRRVIYDFSGKRYTRLESAGLNYRPVENIELPYRATEVLDIALRMGPTDASIDGSVPELRKQNFGKVSLDCVMLSKPNPHPLPQGHPKPYAVSVPLGLFPTYCLSPGTDDILLRYNYGGEFFQFKKLGRFEEHEVPLDLMIVEGPAVVANASVSTLQTYEPTPDEFLPTPELKAGGIYARVSAGVIQGNKIGGPTPVYPESAREEHIGGSVVLRALIGRDGHIHSLEPMQSPDLSLTIAAIQAVKKWRYKPYMLNGEATDVDTMITVNFNLSGG